jgi:hypothetical protein
MWAIPTPPNHRAINTVRLEDRLLRNTVAPSDGQLPNPGADCATLLEPASRSPDPWHCNDVRIGGRRCRIGNIILVLLEPLEGLCVVGVRAFVWAQKADGNNDPIPDGVNRAFDNEIIE